MYDIRRQLWNRAKRKADEIIPADWETRLEADFEEQAEPKPMIRYCKHEGRTQLEFNEVL